MPTLLFFRPAARIALALAATLGSFSAHAGDGRIPGNSDPVPAGVMAVPAMVSQCLGCHGPTGHSQNQDWPNLAGQKQSYLLQQLTDFRSGARRHPMMDPVVKLLSDADLNTLAHYFSTQSPAQPRHPAAANAKMPAAGTACMACHDNAALPIEPYLHAQKAPYLIEQLRAFRAGKRKNAVMAPMAKSLSDQDIEAIAQHFSAQAPISAAKP
jgi:cytochrome c553